MSSNDNPITGFGMISILVKPTDKVGEVAGIGIWGRIVVDILRDNQAPSIRSADLVYKYRSTQASQAIISQPAITIQNETPLSTVGNIAVSASPTGPVIGANSVGVGTPEKQQGQQF